MKKDPQDPKTALFNDSRSPSIGRRTEGWMNGGEKRERI